MAPPTRHGQNHHQSAIMPDKVRLCYQSKGFRDITDNITKLTKWVFLYAKWHHTMENFPHHWYFVKVIHRSPVDFSIKGPLMVDIGAFCVVNMNKLLCKQWSCWLFETPWRSWDIPIVIYTIKRCWHILWAHGVPYRVITKISGPRLNIKTVLSTCGDFHVKDKTAVRTSYL